MADRFKSVINALYTVKSTINAGVIRPVLEWLMEYGLWNDAGYWDDTETWNEDV